MKQLFCKTTTPLFSTSDFIEHVINSPSQYVDEQGLYRPLECQLFSGTPVIQCDGNEVEVPSYAKGRYFTDARLLSPIKTTKLPFPTKEEIFTKLYECGGLPYVWGGNDPHGMAAFMQLYNREESFFKGVDCSGLLYYAYNGHLPRNTSQLATFGEKIPLSEIQPLDICVWKGHVIIFLSQDEVIESREKRGVVRTPLKKRLEELYELGYREGEYDSVNEFVVRRVFQSAEKLFLET